MTFIIQTAANAYIIILILRWLGDKLIPALGSQTWFNKIVQITEPTLSIVRKILPTIGGWDLSYFASIVGIHLITKILIF